MYAALCAARAWMAADLMGLMYSKNGWWADSAQHCSWILWGKVCRRRRWEWATFRTMEWNSYINFYDSMEWEWMSDDKMGKMREDWILDDHQTEQGCLFARKTFWCGQRNFGFSIFVFGGARALSIWRIERKCEKEKKKKWMRPTATANTDSDVLTTFSMAILSTPLILFERKFYDASQICLGKFTFVCGTQSACVCVRKMCFAHQRMPPSLGGRYSLCIKIACKVMFRKQIQYS